MSERFDRLRQDILENCIKCGECAKVCPSIEIAGIDHLKPKMIQEHLFDFLKKPQPDDIVSKRIDSCLECFKCVDVCPKDLNPLIFIEIAKSLSFQNGYEPYVSAQPDNYSTHHASIQNDLNEKQRRAISKRSMPAGNRYVFFPGCNIHNAATRLIKVKKILNQITGDIAYIPGLQFCCGGNFIFDGRLVEAEQAYLSLEQEIGWHQSDTVILWCPTCMTHMKKTWNSRLNYVSFFQFCLDNIHKLRFSEEAIHRIATLHEPCKTAYTGIDQSHRDVIAHLPNIELREMASETRCCGSGGMSHYKNRTIERVTTSRLQEAAETQADMLITVCHYCQELFEEVNSNENLQIVNLADLVYQELEDHEKL